RDEPAPGPGWQPLLQPAMRGGCLLDLPTLPELRALHLAEMERLPEALRRIDRVEPYPVQLSPILRARQQEAVAAIRAREGL
ncbi:MAG: nicotinate phosphoribosyltransferase, partial [Chloroflexota bacterium]